MPDQNGISWDDTPNAAASNNGIQWDDAPAPHGTSGAWDTSSQTGSALKSFASQINPITAIKGAYNAIAHPQQTAAADLAQREQIGDEADQLAAQGNWGQSAIKRLRANVPYLGPALDAAGNKMNQGNMGGGIGDVAGMATNLAMPSIVKGLKGAVGPALSEAVNAAGLKRYTNALPITATSDAADVAQAAEGGYANKIPLTKGGQKMFPGAVKSAVQAIDDAALNQPGAQTATIPSQPIIDAIRQGASRYQFPKAVGPVASRSAQAFGETADALQTALTDPTTGQVRDLTVPEALSLKQGMGSILGDEAWGQLLGGERGAAKNLIKATGSALVDKYPGLGPANQNYGNLMELEPFLDKSVNKQATKFFPSFGDTLTAGAAKAVTGSNPAAAAAGIGRRILTSPGFQSRLALGQKALSESSLPGGAASGAALLDQLGQLFKSPNDVVNAVTNGDITWDQGAQVLRANGWAQ